MTRHDLAKIKARALRTKVWFRALSKVERAIVDLTIKCVENIQSSVLAYTISTITSKILLSLDDTFLVKAERIGQSFAEMLCSVGERWGNKASSAWKRDKRFVKFLGVTALNA